MGDVGRQVRLPDTVGLVLGRSASPVADEAVHDLLRSAGVGTIVRTDGSEPRAPLTVWLGTTMPAPATFEEDLSAGLAPGGFALAIGQDSRRRGHVVLHGADPAGTFYAVSVLRTAVRRTPTGAYLPRMVRRESPSMPVRGVVEAFYGTSWSHRDRIAMMAYLGAHRMNTYVYAPKDDPYHRDKWREPYPPEELAALADLVAHARRHHVDIVYAIAPGQSIGYSSDADFHALRDKFETLYGIGVRSFCVALDDIDDDSWHSPVDLANYGSGDGAAGRAHADLLNRVLDEWASRKPDVGRLHLVPSEYFNVTDSPYKKALRDNLDRSVIVHWTGVTVSPAVVTRAQAREARRVFGHDILLWDSFPGNDYLAGRLPLGTYTGRQRGLSDEVIGVLSTPMNQAAVSKLAVSSVGDYCWNDRGFDPVRSWNMAVAELAGGDPATRDALSWFADLCWFDGTLHPARAPRLTHAITEYWNGRRSGRPAEAAWELQATLEALSAMPRRLRAGLADTRFVEEADAWLGAADAWAEAMTAALDGLVALDHGDAARAWERRQDALTAASRARHLRDGREPHCRMLPLVADGVADAFVDDAGRIFEEAVGLGASRPTAFSSLDVWADNEPALALDGDPMTYFQTNRSPVPGDHLTVDLGAERPVTGVTIRQTHAYSPSDYLRAGVIEYSVDGRQWHVLAHVSTPEVNATAPPESRARYVRLRALADNDPHWLVVRDFEVRTTDETTLAIGGLPEPVKGSALSAAIDDDLDSAYVAARPPLDQDALTVTLSRPRVITRLIVLQYRGRD
ncbi:MAG TPA: beta-N-acetylglucosaminidase domain-containing protein, partial [Actinopolymorphaceae bacterium]